jgi:hypothetical protein
MKPFFFRSFFCLLMVGLLTACAGNTRPSVEPAGREKSAKTGVLEAGAAILQSQRPLAALNIYLDGFHFHNGEMGRQVEAHHYCSQVNEDLVQCVIYDGNGTDALLMGIEYVISAKLFKTLPEEEKKMWHSHAYEVKSGMLVGPGLPGPAEHELMEKLVSTYGKTWHTWHVELPGNTLPLGIPALMMGFTADGQARPGLIADRDNRFGISTEEKSRSRADIPTPVIQPGADAWQTGDVLQLDIKSSAGKKKEGARAPKRKQRQTAQ